MLRLTQIELLGFKSFPHKTVLDLTGGVNCVVGPNGSGKSNVADAIMFAFGSQSSRELRTSNLSGLIFAGTESQRPLNMASVTLHFERTTEPLAEQDFAIAELEDELENYESETGAALQSAAQIEARHAGAKLTRHLPAAPPKAYDPTPAVMKQLAELRAGDRISLTRRVFRDGTGGYFINGEPVRLKDVDGFFERYHLGRSAVFSITQGEVERKILASPQEMREWLAEATGVSHLLTQKERAQTKLKRTQQNLERLSDIRGHTATAVEELAGQRAVAEQHVRLSRELREVELAEIRREVESVQAQLDSSAKAAEEVAERLTQARAELEQRQGGDAAGRQRWNALEAELEAGQRQLTELRAQLEQRRREIAVAERAEQAAAEAIQQAQHDDAELATQLETLSAELAAGDGQQAEARERANALRQTENECQAALDAARAGLDAAAQQLTALARSSFELAQQSAAISNELEAVDRHSRQLVGQLDSRERYLQASRARVDEMRAELTAEEAAEAALAGEVETLRARRDSCVTTLADMGSRLLAGDEATARLRGSIAELNARRKAIEEIEIADNSGGALKLLEHASLAERLARATDATFPPELRGAFTRVLAQYSDAVIGAPDLRGDILAALEGSDCALLTNTAAPTLHRRSIWPQLNAAPATRNALANAIGDVAVADTLPQAEALLSEAEAVVLADGSALLSRSVSLLGRPSVERARQVSRRTDLAQLEAELADFEAKLAQAEAEHAQLKAEQARLQWDRDEASAALAGAEARHASAASLLQRLREGLSERAAELELLESQRLELTEHHDSLLAGLPELQERLTGLQQQRDEQARQQAELEQHRAAAEAKLEQVRSAAQQAVTERQLAEQTVAHLEQLGFDLAERLANTRQRRTQLAARIEALETEAHGARQDAAAAQDHCGQIETTLATLEQRIEQQREQRGALAAELEQAQARAASLAQEVSRLENDTVNLEHTRERAAERIAEHITDLRERFHLTLSQLLGWSPVASIPGSLSGLRDRRAELRVELEGLGSVNLLAIDQHSQQLARLQYLERQTADLAGAIEDLAALVGSLDSRTEAQYRASLERIERGFNEMFVQLFGEGWAKLRFDTPDSIIDSGVEVEVQIPGGRRHNLRSLSGGQRSLIFLALFFAVHGVRSPGFCILDEADAALDDANVGRFAQLIERFATPGEAGAIGEQFIVVTHNKRTMEIADKLIGVVGRPKGISNLLEVDLKDARRLAERVA